MTRLMIKAVSLVCVVMLLASCSSNQKTDTSSSQSGAGNLSVGDISNGSIEWDVDIMSANNTNGDDTIELSCKDHPGVPGFDTEYEISVRINNRIANKNDYILSCDNPDVSISGVVVTVPYKVKEQNDMITVKATLKSDKNCYDIYPIKFKKWEETMIDEMDNDTLNTDYWSVRPSWPSEKEERTNPANISFSDGKMILTADKIPHEGAPYSHIFIHTKDKFTQTYGCFTASVRVADKGGTNTAFWLLPNEGDWGKGYLYHHTDADRWCGEIDMLETSPDSSWNNKFQTTLHYWTGDGTARATGWSDRFEYGDDRNEYHEYSCVWTKSSLFLYYDGKLLHTEHGIEATDNPAYLLLDLELAAHESTGNYDWCGTYKDDDLPIYAYVDYVRVYK